eukprot:11221680-Lingulodinium_polyedra.AAC.1
MFLRELVESSVDTDISGADWERLGSPSWCFAAGINIEALSGFEESAYPIRTERPLEWPTRQHFDSL